MTTEAKTLHWHGVLSAAYKTERARSEMVAHLCYEGRPLCGKVPREHICDAEAGDDERRCPACLRLFAKEVSTAAMPQWVVRGLDGTYYELRDGDVVIARVTSPAFSSPVDVPWEASAKVAGVDKFVGWFATASEAMTACEEVLEVEAEKAKAIH